MAFEVVSSMNKGVTFEVSGMNGMNLCPRDITWHLKCWMLLLRSLLEIKNYAFKFGYA